MLMTVKGHYMNTRIDNEILTDREREVITKTFELEKRDLLDLQNLRDFVFAVCHNQYPPTKVLFDLLTAVLFLIDEYKIKLGGSL